MSFAKRQHNDSPNVQITAKIPRNNNSSNSKSSISSEISNPCNLQWNSSSSKSSFSLPLFPFLITSPYPSASTCATGKSIVVDDIGASSSGYPCSWKRKRRSSDANADNVKDSDVGLEPPSAKRQQRLPSLCHNDEPSSVVSSVYTSPVDGHAPDESDTRLSTDCISTLDDDDAFASYWHNTFKHNDLNASSDDDDGDDERDDADDEDDDDDDEDDDDEDDDDDDDGDMFVRSSPRPIENTLTANDLKDSDKDLLDSLHFYTGERTPGIDEYAAQCMTPAAEPKSRPQCPLPAMSWANAYDVWLLMCKKDEQTATLRDSRMLQHHPGLQPRMRAILLDWLIEVCEVYKLHRETYYLAVDFLDRYLSVQRKVQKTHLQLIGITCLFVAAKVEEIYPPKIGEFAYVTDGACTEEDILQHEILLLQALEWSISPVTPMIWLGVYMQLNVSRRTPASLGSRSANTSHTNAMSTNPCDADDAFIYPQFSGFEFVQTTQLLDLCTLDVNIGNFPYSVIAAAAMSHTFNKDTAVRCSGLDWHSIEACALWMQPFFDVVSEEAHLLGLTEQNDQVGSKCGLGRVCPNIVTDESHIIQTHTISMTMFDRVCLLQEQKSPLITAAKIKHEASPATGLICPEGLLTPPASNRKPMLAVVDEEDPAVIETITATNTATAKATTTATTRATKVSVT